uniref:Uncharacterized protein n=1 Tax=Chromera velia CCMP2878 TaxID=1169474 RepID=A0A0G4FMV2_9ALVE|eukprot:Cvel_17857.t1-p1 / transcript=Cvel_17857.t1 / gene=Cvel_17857 / organism=Chromera_velia_CCMP2878 / gene_product=hypothetical protein / transcript_product=hypothetical protein / location=Cvel_scaffold1448:14049-18811(+) / protein_length=516 / sequence_SO=supercontig / SO=protein_coding / is_pseudo=false
MLFRALSVGLILSETAAFVRQVPSPASVSSKGGFRRSKQPSPVLSSLSAVPESAAVFQIPSSEKFQSLSSSGSSVPRRLSDLGFSVVTLQEDARFQDLTSVKWTPPPGYRSLGFGGGSTSSPVELPAERSSESPEELKQEAETLSEKIKEIRMRSTKETKKKQQSGGSGETSSKVQLDDRQRQFVLIKKGMDQTSDGDYKGAEKTFSNIIDKYEQGGGSEKSTSLVARAYSNRGNVRSLLGDTNGAILDFSEAIELDPDQPDFWANRGLIYQQIGDTARSDALSDVWKKAGNQAKQLKSKEIDLQTVYNEVNQPTSVSGVKRGRGERKLSALQLAAQWYQEANDNYDHTLVLSPGDAKIYASQADIASNLGDHAKAQKLYAKALTISPGNPGIAARQALEALQAGDFKSGESLIYNVLRSYPDFWELQLAKSVLLFINGDPVSGVGLYKVATQQEPLLLDELHVVRDLRWPQKLVEQLRVVKTSGQDPAALISSAGGGSFSKGSYGSFAPPQTRLK